jgi:hypothetical protein
MLIPLHIFTSRPAATDANCEVTCEVTCNLSSLNIRYSLNISLAEAQAKLAWPDPLAHAGRTSGLWEHTCFEVFLRQPGSAAYIEVNAAPTGAWNCFGFSDYRQDMHETREPRVTTVLAGSNPQAPAQLQLVLDLQDWCKATGPAARSAQSKLQLGLSAVIEDKQGVLGYFALGHANGKPDFHHHLNHSLTIPWSHP